MVAAAPKAALPSVLASCTASLVLRQLGYGPARTSGDRAARARVACPTRRRAARDSLARPSSRSLSHGCALAGTIGARARCSVISRLSIRVVRSDDAEPFDPRPGRVRGRVGRLAGPQRSGGGGRDVSGVPSVAHKLFFARRSDGRARLRLRRCVASGTSNDPSRGCIVGTAPGEWTHEQGTFWGASRGRAWSRTHAGQKSCIRWLGRPALRRGSRCERTASMKACGIRGAEATRAGQTALRRPRAE
mmetsp:Transcript_19053/g.57754  ORF Transcript_19053/g.57754 Transcript_19053/m.57754 type:complete len:247 (+) Transcript_19053:128-868(+)